MYGPHPGHVFGGYGPPPFPMVHGPPMGSFPLTANGIPFGGSGCFPQGSGYFMGSPPVPGPSFHPHPQTTALCTGSQPTLPMSAIGSGNFMLSADATPYPTLLQNASPTSLKTSGSYVPPPSLSKSTLGQSGSYIPSPAPLPSSTTGQSGSYVPPPPMVVSSQSALSSIPPPAPLPASTSGQSGSYVPAPPTVVSSQSALSSIPPLAPLPASTLGQSGSYVPAPPTVASQSVPSSIPSPAPRFRSTSGQSGSYVPAPPTVVSSQSASSSIQLPAPLPASTLGQSGSYVPPPPTVVSSQSASSSIPPPAPLPASTLGQSGSYVPAPPTVASQSVPSSIPSPALLPRSTSGPSGSYVPPPPTAVSSQSAPYPIQSGNYPQPSSQGSTSSGVSSQAPSSISSRNDVLLPVIAPQLHGQCCGPERPVTEVAREIWSVIDPQKTGSISKLELCMAMQHDRTVSQFVLPGIDSSHIMDNEDSFNAVDAVFEAIGNRKHRISTHDFVSYFQGAKQVLQDADDDIVGLFKAIDANGNGSISKLEFLNALQRDPSIAARILPGVDISCVTTNVQLFDTINDVFDDIAGGRRVIEHADFIAFFRRSQNARPSHHVNEDRSTKRVLIIGPGFGLDLNPRQGDVVMRAGFQVKWVVNVPNPEQYGICLMQYLPVIKAAIDEFSPHLVVAASKGGHYMIALWQTGLWRGPSLMLNAHPSLRELPPNVPIVIAAGSNDELYPRSRADLEQLVSTGTPNLCFLYYTGNSGPVQGRCTRVGDRHNMDSLLVYDCLPRLIDAAMCHQGPEMQFVWSWRQRLSPQRVQAEEWLSYCPEQMRRRWASRHQKGLDDQKLFEVPRNSQEFRMVAAVFHAWPLEPPAYGGPNPAWDRTGIVKIHRIENGLQDDGSAKPYYAALRASIEDQGVTFEPGVHTRWAFHGTDAVESIINNPLSGFQPLASGSRLGSVWGSGSYFARDAKYVVDGNFCQPAADGTRQMLMCLMMTGIPCLGDPQQKGVLPFRQKPHRYNSSVDSLSNPEVFVVQHPSAAHPAYLISFTSFN